MGIRTGIQWCDSTLNSTTGCDGCELWPGPCYAGWLHETRLAKSLPALYDADFRQVRLAPGRAAKAAAWSDLRGVPRPDKPWIPPATPRLIFVNDLSDLFSRAVPFAYVAAEVIGAATSPKGARHVWMLLTKQPARMAQFADWLRREHGVDWPQNVWAGTSLTTARTVTRLDHLVRVPAPVLFASVEPQREVIDLSGYLGRSGERPPAAGPSARVAPRLGLVIQGGESDQGGHTGHPFDAAWARRLRDACRAAGVPYFLKQLGPRPYDSATAVPVRDGHGGDWSEWPSDLRIRELPCPT